MNTRKSLFHWLTNRYQLVIRDEGDLSERSTFKFSYAKLISLGAVLLGILVVCSLSLATTVLAKWLNPAYVEQENKAKIIQLATAVDTLEQQTNQQKKFIKLLQSIIAGKEPPEDELPIAADEQTAPMPTPYSSEQMVAADVLLRSELEHLESSPPTTYNKPLKHLQEFLFFPPIHGVVTTPFQHGIGHYGVDIVAKENAPIQCIADGAVVFSAWTVETGWVMVIQHNKDLVSIYKHNAALLRKVGNFVKRGEVVAIMGNSGEFSTGPHLHFELWYEGKALNPEHFITF